MQQMVRVIQPFGWSRVVEQSARNDSATRQSDESTEIKRVIHSAGGNPLLYNEILESNLNSVVN